MGGGGGGGVAFYNSGHRLALGHVNDMTSHQQSFRYKGTGLPGLNQC